MRTCSFITFNIPYALEEFMHLIGEAGMEGLTLLSTKGFACFCTIGLQNKRVVWSLKRQLTLQEIRFCWVPPAFLCVFLLGTWKILCLPCVFWNTRGKHAAQSVCKKCTRQSKDTQENLQNIHNKVYHTAKTTKDKRQILDTPCYLCEVRGGLDIQTFSSTHNARRHGVPSARAQKPETKPAMVSVIPGRATVPPSGVGKWLEITYKLKCFWNISWPCINMYRVSTLALVEIVSSWHSYAMQILLVR
jgi:hypothetical protein